jgi:hypothetical protein
MNKHEKIIIFEVAAVIFRKGFLLLCLSAMSFTSYGNYETVYFQSLIFLKEAGAPRIIELVDTSLSHSTTLSQGVLITYKNRGARRVDIAGNFSHWKPASMHRSNNGIWHYFLKEFHGSKTIQYKFVVDGIWTLDPLNNEREDDGCGSYISIVEQDFRKDDSHVSYRQLEKGVIEFRIYRPQANIISLVGDFNNWDPEHDLMTKGDDGIWRLQKKLSRGNHRYKYIVDGEWNPDVYNEKSAADPGGGICSLVKID